MVERVPTHIERIEIIEITLGAQNNATNEKFERLKEMIH